MSLELRVRVDDCLKETEEKLDERRGPVSQISKGILVRVLCKGVGILFTA